MQVEEKMADFANIFSFQIGAIYGKIIGILIMNKPIS